MAEKKVNFKLDRAGLVKITHAETKGEAMVMPESVPVWLESGWEVADPEEEQSDAVVAVDPEKRAGQVVPVTDKK